MQIQQQGLGAWVGEDIQANANPGRCTVPFENRSQSRSFLDQVPVTSNTLQVVGAPQRFYRAAVNCVPKGALSVRPGQVLFCVSGTLIVIRRSREALMAHSPSFPKTLGVCPKGWDMFQKSPSGGHV